MWSRLFWRAKKSLMIPEPVSENVDSLDYEVIEMLLESARRTAYWMLDSFRGGECKGDSLFYVYDDERILPVRYRKKYVFKWTLLLSEPYNMVDTPQRSLEEFLDMAIRVLEKRLSSMWTISTASGFFADTPSKNCWRIPFGSHVIDLSLPEEELWKKIHSKHRNVIRKAEKDGVAIRHGGLELLDDYISIDKETWERSNTKAPGKDYYLNQVKSLKRKLDIYVAYFQGSPQAGAIFYVNQAMCYYMYGCSANFPRTGSANLLQWNAILEMKNMGVEKFSFVGCRINEDEDSKYHGIQRFKERFGGELVTGYLFRVVSKPCWYKLFCKGMQLASKSKEPYKDAIDEEIEKWRDIQK